LNSRVFENGRNFRNPLVDIFSVSATELTHVKSLDLRLVWCGGIVGGCIGGFTIGSLPLEGGVANHPGRLSGHHIHSTLKFRDDTVQVL
jgi:hypothetical protein